VKPAGRNLTHVVLEGYIDPAGSIPEWITNMLITESPIKVITEIKQRMEKSTK
jgi:predicted DNA-binding transcriptional regulator